MAAAALFMQPAALMSRDRYLRTARRSNDFAGVQGFNGAYEAWYVDRLDQMKVEPRRGGSPLVIFLTVARDCDESNASEGILLTQPCCELVAVHDGEADVEKCNVRVE